MDKENALSKIQQAAADSSSGSCINTRSQKRKILASKKTLEQIAAAGIRV